jgi:hypothetical protein
MVILGSYEARPIESASFGYVAACTFRQVILSFESWLRIWYGVY